MFYFFWQFFVIFRWVYRFTWQGYWSGSYLEFWQLDTAVSTEEKGALEFAVYAVAPFMIPIHCDFGLQEVFKWLFPNSYNLVVLETLWREVNWSQIIFALNTNAHILANFRHHATWKVFTVCMDNIWKMLQPYLQERGM